MHLTRCEIDPAQRGARRLLGSPQAMHAAVLGGFDHLDDAAKQDGRLLWRVDQGPAVTWLYVVSGAEPRLDGLLEQAGTPGTQQTRPYGRVLERLEAGQRWAFRLRGNPVYSAANPDGGRGRRVAYAGVAGQTEWLLKKAEGTGVWLGKEDEPDFAVTRRGVAQFGRRSDGTQRQVTLAWAQFDGVLEVRDPELLRDAMTGGVGRAKGYGCGLLTLAPVP
ncbi:type I-E CRISPR-associated protein Cas6/Cse3/CasE [Myceligenerans crystallogenes]|uniref:Type I-E CRISPR-associated protein Cas6/Cse3/CasE n=1 Tax=Myceligenerans crystallogenes TaxID=316335 RepID=A0ABN2NJ81_9MICO